VAIPCTDEGWRHSKDVSETEQSPQTDRQTDRPVPALRPPSCSQCRYPGNKPIDVFNTKLCEIFIVSRHFYWFHLHIGITSSANGASWATEPVRSSDKQHNQTWLILQTAFQRPSLQEHRVSCNHHCTGSVVHSVQLSTGVTSYQKLNSNDTGHCATTANINTKQPMCNVQSNGQTIQLHIRAARLSLKRI